jgi:hypothetical protein
MRRLGRHLLELIGHPASTLTLDTLTNQQPISLPAHACWAYRSSSSGFDEVQRKAAEVFHAMEGGVIGIVLVRRFDAAAAYECMC